MKYLFFILTILISLNGLGQIKFKIKEVETKDYKSIYFIVNEKGQTIKKLDSTKYLKCFNTDEFVYFAIFALRKGLGWSAIDANEKELFNVYNTSFGEPSPDELVENKIRIVDENNKIGFADYKGRIIIRPQFEIATVFCKGKAIIGESCDKIPWDNHAGEGDCHHYSIVCKKHGYINTNGKILEIGNYEFEDIQKKIKWKARE